MLVALLFRARRAAALLRRGLSSLRSRGLQATLERVFQRRTPLLSQLALVLPESPDRFEPYELAFTSSTAPLAASIVIPVYNKFRYTDTCLRALRLAGSTLSVEVIVVDDCSNDESPSRLVQIGGIRYIRNPNNLGFIGACNAGAAAARGEVLVFLNNDTAVQAGWLEALINTLHERADAGLVGAMLIYPDGRLQESGGIVFSDGSGWNYGRFGDPCDPQYNFVREVDYCSGAAIAIRRGLFDEFGGFDALYSPAYYEDTDIAFKVRAAGLKCYVQPAARVVHYEGISSGTDLNHGVKRYQLVNQQKFLTRWQQVLATHPTPPPKSAIARSAQHRSLRHILIVDVTTPKPDQDSGSLRMVNLLKILLEESCAVTFFCEGRHYHAGYAEALQQLGVQVLFRPYLRDEPAWLAEHGKRFDVVMLSRHYVAAPLLPLIRRYCPQAQLIFDTVDLHFLREQREAELQNDAARASAAAKTQAQELAIMRACDLTLVVSPIEQALLQSLAPAVKVHILSNIHDIPGSTNGFGARQDLLFVGGFQHAPNVDAISWFVQDVLPQVWRQLPDVKLHVVGSNTPEQIKKLASERIIVHGFVPEIDSLLQSARLSIAPLRYGAGVKGKVNMAMAHGLPVIATSAAVEGMHCRPGIDVMVGASAEEFATALLAAYQDEALWQQLSTGGLTNVTQHFSFAAAQESIHEIFAQLGL